MSTTLPHLDQFCFYRIQRANRERSNQFCKLQWRQGTTTVNDIVTLELSLVSLDSEINDQVILFL